MDLLSGWVHEGLSLGAIITAVGCYGPSVGPSSGVQRGGTSRIDPVCGDSALGLGPAEQFTRETQGFIFQRRVLRPLGNGALERLDQLDDGSRRSGRRRRRARRRRHPAAGAWQPALDGSNSVTASGTAKFPPAPKRDR